MRSTELHAYYDTAEAFARQGLEQDTLLEPYMDYVARQVISSDCLRALDVGTGRGYLVAALRKVGVDAYGTELSRYAILHGIDDVRPYICQANADGALLPFQSGSFDLVTCLEVLEHVAQPLKLIDEFARITRSGAVVFITTPALPFESPIWHKLKLQYEPLHISVHSRGFWRKAFQARGFCLIRERPDIIRERTRLSPRESRQQHWAIQFVRRSFPAGASFLGEALTSFATASLGFRRV